MRASTIVVAALSALAMAAPVDKRAYVTDLVVEYVYVTVTEGQPLPTTLPVSISKHYLGVSTSRPWDQLT